MVGQSEVSKRHRWDETSGSTISTILRRTQSYLNERLTMHLAQRGFADIRPSYGRAILVVIEDNGIRPGEIGKRVHLARPSVTQMLVDLQRLGYIRLIPADGDGRGKLVIPTERGRSAREAARESCDLAEADLAKALGAKRFLALEETCAGLEDWLSSEPDLE